MQLKAILSLSRIINELRIIEPDFPASYAAVLLTVAKHIETHGEEPFVGEVADAVGIYRPSMSRIILSMSDRRLGQRRTGDAPAEGSRKALGLLTRTPDSKDLRMIRVGLTPKGRGLVNRLADHLIV